MSKMKGLDSPDEWQDLFGDKLDKVENGFGQRSEIPLNWASSCSPSSRLVFGD